MAMWRGPWLMLVEGRPPPVPIQWRCGHLMANFWWSFAMTSTGNGRQACEVDVQPFSCFKEPGTAIRMVLWCIPWLMLVGARPLLYTGKAKNGPK